MLVQTWNAIERFLCKTYLFIHIIAICKSSYVTYNKKNGNPRS